MLSSEGNARRCCIFFFRTNTILSGRKDILGKVETVDCCGVVGVRRAFRASLFDSRSISCRSTHGCITNIALIPCYGYAKGIPTIPISDAPICLLFSVFYFLPPLFIYIMTINTLHSIHRSRCSCWTCLVFSMHILHAYSRVA